MADDRLIEKDGKLIKLGGRLIKEIEPDVGTIRKWIITYRDDGTIECLFEFVGKPFIEGLDVTDYNELQRVREFIDEYIVVNRSIRRRTEQELKVRTREIYNRVKSGELSRSKGDLIEQYETHFTEEELQEVESQEKKIVRLRTELEEIKSKIQT